VGVLAIGLSLPLERLESPLASPNGIPGSCRSGKSELQLSPALCRV
jgi:hypothetical protein